MRLVVATFSLTAGCTYLFPFVDGAPDASDPSEDGGVTDASDDADAGDRPCREADVRCADGVVQTCQGGTWGAGEPCDHGCSTTDATRCAIMRPSTVALDFTVSPDEATELLDAEWDTDACTDFGGVVVEPIDGAQLDVCVLQVGTLALPEGVFVGVRGQLPLVILASGQVTIGGRLDASAIGATPGPGGARGGDDVRIDGAGSTGGDGATYDTNGSTGAAGGGGACGAGGAGGGGAEPVIPPPGPAAAYPIHDDARWMRVVGGGGGGAGAGLIARRSRGGAGGGALQISSLVEIVVGDRGWIAAAGGGGAGACADVVYEAECSGAGGGGGGSIWLEAPRIQIAAGGFLNAGGGGGGGAGNEVAAGAPGSDGRDSDGQARGGAAPAPGGGGGLGGGGLTIEGEAGQAGLTWGNGGGGGGGAGCLVILSADAAIGSPELNPDVVVEGEPVFD